MIDLKLNAIAIDDEPPALEVIKAYSGRVPFLRLLATYNNPIAGYKAVEELRPDLLFLDIQMPEVSGIRIAELLPSGQMVIFTTAHSRYAVEGFNLNAMDYLLKPFDFDRFLQAVNKAREQQLLRHPLPNKDLRAYVLVKVDYQNVKVFLDDIQYIEALDNYVKIHTADTTHLTLMNLKAFSAQLPPEAFVRVHKSYVIPLARIHHFTKEKVVIDGYTIPVGRSYAGAFLELVRKSADKP